MSETLLFILFAIITGIAGFFIGKIITGLKQKSEAGKLEASLLHSKEEIVKLEKEAASLVEEKENIRNEKEAVNLELTKRTSELQNLAQKLQEQKAEVEKLNEKFTKEFEN